MNLPTRLSTKEILRSHCRTSGGGSRGHAAAGAPLVPLDVAVGQGVRLGCFRSSGGTGQSVTLEVQLLKPLREQCDAFSGWGKPRPEESPDSSFSQMTSTAVVEDEEIELWIDAESNEKIEEDDDEAEEPIEEEYG